MTDLLLIASVSVMPRHEKMRSVSDLTLGLTRISIVAVFPVITKRLGL